MCESRALDKRSISFGASEETENWTKKSKRTKAAASEGKKKSLRELKKREKRTWNIARSAGTLFHLTLKGRKRELGGKKDGGIIHSADEFMPADSK